MYIYIYVYTYVRICIYTHTYLSIYTYTYASVRLRLPPFLSRPLIFLSELFSGSIALIRGSPAVASGQPEQARCPLRCAASVGCACVVPVGNLGKLRC